MPEHTRAAAPPTALRGRSAALAAVLWTLLIVLLAAWVGETALRAYRAQTLQGAQARLRATQDTLAVALGQLAALPTHLAQHPAVRELLVQQPLPAAGHPARERLAAELRGLARDFGLPYLAVIAPSGEVLASASTLTPPGGWPALNLAQRGYFIEAMRSGKGMQFLLGRVSSVPGLYASRRVDGDARALGVVVVKQDADVLNRLLGDAAGHAVLLSDSNGVTVLGNRPELLLRRLGEAAPSAGIDWVDIYQRVPPEQPWALAPVAIGSSAAPATRLGGQPHLVQSAALPGTPLTAWVLAPLAEERVLRSGMAAAFALLWLFGMVLIWLGWRRLQLVQDALLARREADEVSLARQATEARFAAVFEHAAASYLFFTSDGITHCNPATLRLFGVDDPAELIGRIPWFPALSPDRQADGQPSRERALALMKLHTRSRARVQASEWRFQRRDGTTVDTEAAVIALSWDGKPQFCAVIQDITARKQAEAAMHEARAAAEAASQTKSNFLANMSHELRTPMNAIIGMTHLALEDGLPPKQRDYVRKAHGAARNLLQILNDILDVSKIESGKLQLEQIEFEPETVLRDTADLLALKADEKGLELLLVASPDLPARLRGDPTRLRQVLTNLGDNAIKFTERGEVTMGLGLRAQDEHGIELNGWVRDSGVGLSEAQLAQLFQPFVQGDSSTTRRYGGTGLGLVISRQLVERMGGRLWVDSRPGEGSAFHFTARFGRVEAPADAPPFPAAPGLPGGRALLVDDNVPAREVLAGVLQKPVTPSTLHDAMQMARSGVAVRPPALDARPAAGADETAQALAGARVLLVEDHPLNQELACELLRRAGIEVVLAANGAEALERLADAGPFDGVLMDCQMPVMDGYTATRRLRADPAWRDLPVIAMTASALAEDRQRSLAAGMNAHITKPLNVPVMLATMAQWIRVRPEAARPAPPPTAPGELLDDWPPPCEAIDTRAGLAYSVGRRELYRRLLAGFRAKKSDFEAAAHAALAEGRLDELRQRVHDLKGLAGTIGANGLYRATFRLEQALGGPQAQAALVELCHALRRVLRDIDTLTP